MAHTSTTLMQSAPYCWSCGSTYVLTQAKKSWASAEEKRIFRGIRKMLTLWSAPYFYWVFLIPNKNKKKLQLICLQIAHIKTFKFSLQWHVTC